MADAKKVARGKTFLEGILEKIPADKREGVKALLEVEDVLEAAGGGALMQDEFSRAMAALQDKENGVKVWRENLTDWHQEKLKSLTDGEARINAAAAQMVPFVSVMSNLSVKHYKEYGELLDTNALLAHSQKIGLALDRGAYEDFVKDKEAEKSKKKYEEDIAAAERRGAERALQQAGSPTPYPIGNSEPTTLSGLNLSAEKKADFGVGAALTEFNKLVRANGGA